MSELHKPKITILASGSGSTAEAFIRATQDGRVDGEVGLIISDVEGAGVFGRIAKLREQYGIDIQTASITRTGFPGGSEGRGITLEMSETMAELIRNEGIGHVGLMGFMQIVRGPLLDEFGWQPHHGSKYQARSTNTHPAILPHTADTYGAYASQKVLDLGLPYSAHTVHLLAQGVDAGPVLCSTPVPVEAGDTAQDLFERVQLVKKAVLPLVIDRFLKEQAAYRGDS